MKDDIVDTPEDIDSVPNRKAGIEWIALRNKWVPETRMRLLEEFISFKQMNVELLAWARRRR